MKRKEEVKVIEIVYEVLVTYYRLDAEYGIHSSTDDVIDEIERRIDELLLDDDLSKKEVRNIKNKILYKVSLIPEEVINEVFY